MKPFVLLLTFGLMTAARAAFGIIGGRAVAAGDVEARSAVMVVRTTGRKCSSIMDRPGPVLDNGHCICSGVLVARDLVLTAGHCVVMAPEGMRVYFGNFPGREWDWRRFVRVRDLRRHPDWFSQTAGRTNDLALLKLDALPPKGYVPARVLRDPRALRWGSPLTIAGFGRTLPGDDPGGARGVLHRFATLVLAPVNRFGQIRLFRSLDLPSRRHGYRSVAFPPGEASGDSGGPAYFKVGRVFTVAGIASGYEFDGHPTYENVPGHAAFLDQAAREMGSVLP